MPPPPPLDLHVASFAELDTRTLHDLIRLRIDVFVVEQACAYPELDGRDLEPGTRHVWLARAGEPVGYLRILTDPPGAGDAGAAGFGDGDPGVARIGRVVVASAARGAGLADRLLTEALTLVGDRTVVLDAQSHLVDLYARYGFVVTGAEYLDDGIPHRPMRRDPRPPAR
ncbi:GNAT family N-acetyltransferase [Micromonospora zhanjiangensis]|uniref:GNAT family N-acetyltransferase n=1 Tax=Micromonospora zhanjiangensis TaxID=1522057 RepID=A0ABV8KH32_9ACTN